MKKKKSKIWVIALIILALVFAGYMGWFKIGNSYSFVPIDCNPGVLCHEATGIYYECPLDVAGCLVKAVMECNNPTSQQKVVMRTNAGSFEDYNTRTSVIWIALRGLISNDVFTSTDDLHVYCVSSVTGGTTTSPIILPDGKSPIYNTQLWAWGSKLYVLTGSTGDIRRAYDLCDSTLDANTLAIAKSNSPVAGMSSKEVVAGTENTFQCNGRYEIYNSLTDYNKNPKPMPFYYDSQFMWSSSKAGNKTSTPNPSQINPGQVVYATGGTTTHIYYSNLKDVETCTIPVCKSDKSGFYECKNGLVNRLNLTDCDINGGYVCEPTLGKCSFALTEKTIKIQDEWGTEKPVFITTDKITVNTKLRSERISSGIVTLQVFSDSDPYNYIADYNKDYIFTSTTYTPIPIDNPSISGGYFIKVYATPTGKDPIYIGSYNFDIAEKIESSVNIRAKEVFGKILVGQEFYIEVNVIDTKSPPQEAKKIYLNITLNGIPLEVPSSYEDITSGTTRTYRFTITANQPGPIVAKGYVESLNGALSKMTSFSSSVESIEVNTDYIDLPTGCTNPGIKTIHFESKDSNDNYIETINSLYLTNTLSSLKNISDLIKRTDVGKYYFTYDFTVDSYSLLLNAYSPVLGKSSQPRTGSFESNNVCDEKECGSNAECVNLHGEGWICSSGTCKDSNPDWLTYLIVGIIAFGIIVFIIIIIKYTKSKQSPDISLGGM